MCSDIINKRPFMCQVAHIPAMSCVGSLQEEDIKFAYIL